MSYTTHEKIRVSAGFQNRFTRQSFLNQPDGSNNIFYVETDDNWKFVPEFGTGNTIANVNDIKVYYGLSGVYGVSQLGISSIDIEQGSVLLSTIPTTGSSLTITYSSSPISSEDIENTRLEAEAIINQRLSICYELPLSTIPSSVISMASRLSAALLLIRGYGTGSQDTSQDGYALYEQLMGSNSYNINQASTLPEKRGEIGLICTRNFQLVDDSGSIMPRTDQDNIEDNNTYIVGGRVKGRLYDITEEPFRYKQYQEDINQDQPGSGKYVNDNCQ